MPAVTAALLIAQGTWDVQKMVNVEELPCKPFINLMNAIGLPTHIRIGHNQDDTLLSFELDEQAQEA